METELDSVSGGGGWGGRGRRGGTGRGRRRELMERQIKKSFQDCDLRPSDNSIWSQPRRTNADFSFIGNEVII